MSGQFRLGLQQHRSTRFSIPIPSKSQLQSNHSISNHKHTAESSLRQKRRTAGTNSGDQHFDNQNRWQNSTKLIPYYFLHSSKAEYTVIMNQNSAKRPEKGKQNSGVNFSARLETNTKNYKKNMYTPTRRRSVILYQLIKQTIK